MKSVQLYKLLSGHAGIINHLARQLYDGDIETEEAITKAQEEEQRVSEIINKDS